jgi:triacylglycerol lipase
MGAMSARYYTRNLGGDAAVASVITLAGANHGTNTAIFCSAVVSCQEMVPGSAFLNALNATDETWGAPRYGTWWSNCDEVINPRSSALLSGGATNTQTACINHSALHEDATVYGQVRDFVKSTTANVNVFAN